jgi:hypothetical protein
MNYHPTDAIANGATPFEADGVYNGVPYRVLPDCSIEAMMPAGVVKFKDMDQLIASSHRAFSGHSTTRSDLLPVLDGGSENSLTTPSDYYSILIRAIDAAKKNSAELRHLVYERARFNMKRDFLFGSSNMPLTDVVRHVNAFEAAVARIESHASDDAPQADAAKADPVEPTQEDETAEICATNDPVALPAEDQTVSARSNNLIQILPPEPIAPLYSPPGAIHRADDSQLARLTEEFVRHARFANKSIGIAIVAVAFIGTVIITMLWPTQSQKQPPLPAQVAATAPQAVASLPPSLLAENAAPPVAQVVKPPFPLPSSFGIYALSDTKLIELQPLPISVPDARVALSAEITKPSFTTIADSKPAFILFRRDLANSVPQKITLRIVARVARDTKIVGGKASTTALDDSWRIRDISRELKVSPIPGQREMLLAQLDDDATLPAGRYALVLNRTGYDFLISNGDPGPTFCLEQFEATNGTVFNQCRAQ